MLLDARDLPDGYATAADICIVGAGAAGIAMALELVSSGLDVLLLESGGLSKEPETQNLYAGTVEDEHLHSPPDRYRQRRFGGSTTIWGGRCMPLDGIDFERRDFVPHSGWPIDLQTLQPFYPKANRLCEAGDFAYTVEGAFGTAPPPMLSGFRSSHFSTNTLERFSCPTDFGSRYQHKLRAAANVQVWLHANVTQLQLDESGASVKEIVALTLSGKRLIFRARQFVLAMGGLEIPRILLANRAVHTNGIGNEHDIVGRYYMCHMAGTVGTLQLNANVAAWNNYDVSDEGVYCRRRLALTADTQRQLKMGNFIARLHHPRITDPAHRTGILSLLYLAKAFIPYEYGKRLHDGTPLTAHTWLQHARNVVGDPTATAAFLTHWFRKRTLATRKFPSLVVKSRANRYSLDFHSEQLPSSTSRVMLRDDSDALGMPRLHIDWRYTEWDIQTVRRAMDLFAADIREMRIGQFDYDPATLEDEVMLYGAYGGHHMGTARMGSSASTSVVDSDCCVHGMNNLFIAGSATFPTSSQANPTLTIVALALRLAQHLKNRAAGDRTGALPPVRAEGTLQT